MNFSAAAVASGAQDFFGGGAEAGANLVGGGGDHVG